MDRIKPMEELTDREFLTVVFAEFGGLLDFYGLEASAESEDETRAVYAAITAEGRRRLYDVSVTESDSVKIQDTAQARIDAALEYIKEHSWNAGGVVAIDADEIERFLKGDA